MKSGFNLNTALMILMIITIIFAAGNSWGSLDTMQAQIADMKNDYARKDVLSERLKSIDDRLGNIEDSINAIRQ